MFSIATKIVKKLALYPIPILVTCFAVAILCIHPVSNLHWELQLQDTISPTGANSDDYHKIEEAFGGLGSLLCLVVLLVTLVSAYFSYRTVQDFLLAKRNERD